MDAATDLRALATAMPESGEAAGYVIKYSDGSAAFEFNPELADEAVAETEGATLHPVVYASPPAKPAASGDHLLDVLRAMRSASTQCYNFAERVEAAIIADGERRAKPAADDMRAVDCRVFTVADLPPTQFQIILTNPVRTPVNGYRGCDVIDIVNAWAAPTAPALVVDKT